MVRSERSLARTHRSKTSLLSEALKQAGWSAPRTLSEFGVESVDYHMPREKVVAGRNTVRVQHQDPLDPLSVEMFEVSGIAGQQILRFPVNRGQQDRLVLRLAREASGLDPSRNYLGRRFSMLGTSSRTASAARTWRPLQGGLRHTGLIFQWFCAFGEH